MTFTLEDLQGSQAADINQTLGQVTGYGFVEGGEIQEGARPFAVDVRSARTYVGGQEVQTDATSIDLTSYAHTPSGTEPARPRKVVIYIGADAEFHVAAGEPARPRPAGRDRFETFQPSPPDFRDMEGVPVAEVWIGANTSHVTDEDIRDRRLNARIEGRNVTIDTADFQTLIDGSGAEKTELMDVADVYDIQDVRDIINADTAHGTDAPHEYFSGSHDDLTAVATGDHHARYADAEAVTAVEGQVDLADLTGTEGTTPRYHLEVADINGNLAWLNPPMAEAPVLKTGVVTHTGGSATSVTITDITPTRSAQFEVGVAIGVDTAPTWAADYAYSVETSYRWDDTGSDVEVDLSLTWDTDPGAGNDLSLRYHVYEMSPDLVTAVYDDERTVLAMTGEDLSLGTVDVGEAFNSPVYDDPANAPSPVTGDVISATDPTTGTFGEYVYDGTAWQGPFGAGVTALSNLTVDIAKDWGTNAITNVGAPTALADAIRDQDISDHTAVSNAHHAKTTSADIDHALIPGLTADAHHSRYGDDEAAATAVLENMTRSIGATTIPDGSGSRVHAVVDENEEMSLRRASAMTEDGTSPTGLSLQIEDLLTGDLLYQQDEKFAVGSEAAPLDTIRGPAVLDIRVRNRTGKTVAAGGEVSYRLASTPYVFGDGVDMFADDSSTTTTDRQGVVVTPTASIVGFELTLSNQIAGATRAYLQQPDGTVLVSADIAALGAGDTVDLIHSTTLPLNEELFVSVDAEGLEYTRGRYENTLQFPYEATEFTVDAGVYTQTGDRSAKYRYNLRKLRAILEQASGA